MRAFVAGCVALVGGCGGTAVEAEVRSMRERLAVNEQARLELSKKVDDLEGRVYLLTDQMETQRGQLDAFRGLPVEPSRRVAPHLPVVKLRPSAGAAASAGGAGAGTSPATATGAAGSSDGESSAADAVPVEQGGSSRPLLHLEATGDGPVLATSVEPHHSARPGTASHKAPTPAAHPAVALRPGARPPPAVHGGVPTPRPAVQGARPSSTGGVVAASTVPAPGVPVRQPERALDNDDLEVSAGDPAALLREAHDKLLAGRSDEAATDFRAFVRRYPRNASADTAQYFLGESYYARKEFAAAAPEYRQVLKRWPASKKAPDALLKLGLCLLALDQVSDGKAALAEVARDYPESEAAHKAQRRLAEASSAERKR